MDLEPVVTIPHVIVDVAAPDLPTALVHHHGGESFQVVVPEKAGAAAGRPLDTLDPSALATTQSARSGLHVTGDGARLVDLWVHPAQRRERLDGAHLVVVADVV